MTIKIKSAIRHGLEIMPVEVECQSVQGRPGLVIIGLAAKALAEASERLSNALTNCGVRLKTRKTILNLAPADVAKKDSTLELAMAVALYLVTTDEAWNLEKTVFFGELSLAGELRPITGAISLVLAAKENGDEQVFLPQANLSEVQTITGIKIYGLNHLQDLINHFRQTAPLAPLVSQKFSALAATSSVAQLNEVIGQEMAKRCLSIAAAGGHNILFTGVPGSGKTMLAQSLISILPPLTEPEAIALTKIYSAGGQLPASGLITTRPFRAPHHNISTVGLIGGGQALLPGEISLAHQGILFLDELAEFRRDALEALRQPLENGQITITRARGQTIYPANFTLVAATNPCPCGHFGSQKKTCTCTPLARERYQKRISGPILDRLDMNIYIHEVEPTQLGQNLTSRPRESLEKLRRRILRARQRQAKRLKSSQLLTNSQLNSVQVREILSLSAEAAMLLNQAAQKIGFSARSYFKIIKTARTIADLADEERQLIEVNDIAEALQYRQRA